MIEAGRTLSESEAPTTSGAMADSPAEVRSLFPIGTVLGEKYRLDRILGIGGMATVFAATHLRNTNRVAVKILHPELGRNIEVRDRFLREGYTANSVRHAGTVRVLDDDTANDGAVFLVMDLLEGETLQALWERRARRLPPSVVAQLMCQVLDILSAAHERGIVHRDVKPENLFIERDGTLRILDFGVARVLDGTLTATRDGTVMGTAPYMAPEQMLGKIHEVDARSDVWSVGATAFALVSGRFVHEAETPEEMLVFAASRQALSLSRVAPHVPDAFIRVVDRALRFDKTERWPGARAMHAAFAQIHRSTGRADEDAMAPLPGANDTASTTRRRARWACGAAAGLAVAGVAILTAHGPQDPPAAPATALVQPLLSSDSSASRVAVLVPWADMEGPAAPPVARPARWLPPRPLWTAALDRASEAAAEPPKDIVVKPQQRARRTDAMAWASEAAVPPPATCTQAFTIVAGTGKKIWKRECF
jgi:tRNA A-37 threonylcarbamoyl transferase component Bud32